MKLKRDTFLRSVKGLMPLSEYNALSTELFTLDSDYVSVAVDGPLFPLPGSAWRGGVVEGIGFMRDKHTNTYIPVVFYKKDGKVRKESWTGKK